MGNSFFVDFHCHPTIKPYGRSFKHEKVNSPDPEEKNSIFHYDPPTLFDKLLNISSTLTKFSQSSISALIKGNVKLIGASLYPIEKNFFSNRIGTGCFSNALSNLVTGVGIERVGSIQKNNDYFADLRSEYDFLEQLNGIPVDVENIKMQYKLVQNVNQIMDNVHNENIETLSVINTIEGSHVFNSFANRRAEEYEVLANVEDLKSWKYKPFFISPGHHFYNQTCGHAQSLSGFLNKILDQTYGMNTEFTALGWAILEKLLDNTNNDRIHIDIKHMSVKARRQYYDYLKNKPDIPIIVSHGALNGLPSVNNRQATTGNQQNIFNRSELNFFDDEIILISESGGIFCIQLDERRIADSKILKNTFLNLCRKKMLFEKSGLVWNQIRHIAEVLDKNGKNAWNLAALGSDFDGIVDPLNGFWTSEELPLLSDYLLIHAGEYMRHDGKKLALPENRSIDPEEIIKNIMCENIMTFLQKHFK
ncbi:MAG: membrane dipeptidase [Bacteroidales bacterium]|nr:membrane dipeptidase [Bacteroidales bacterium]